MALRELQNTAPLSPRERESASEVFSQYEGLDLLAAWQNLIRRACETNRPFRAYDAAHAVASALTRKEQGK